MQANDSTTVSLLRSIEGPTLYDPPDLTNAPNQDIPAAIPSLIDAAVAAFDADRDTSRRYLLRASALLRVNRGARTGAERTRGSESGMPHPNGRGRSR